MLYRHLVSLVVALACSGSFISNANSSVVVVPLGDGFVNIPIVRGEPETPVDDDFLLFDRLTDQQSEGRVLGGRFTDRGWKHESGEDKIVYDLGQSMEAGVIEFELTGLSPQTRGGYLGMPGSERAYYFGLFNDPTGDKRVGGTNPAFIEIRYNWGNLYQSLSAVKFQVGDAGLAGSHREVFGTKRWRDWNPLVYYKHRVEFGNGITSLFIDDVLQVTMPYSNRRLGWRYLFIGDINYAGMSGPDNVTYRNVSVKKIR